jgi:hypothetical protein
MLSEIGSIEGLFLLVKAYFAWTEGGDKRSGIRLSRPYGTGTITPGFMIPFGSSIVLMRFVKSR